MTIRISDKRAMSLAGSPRGRVALHILAWLRDHSFRRHLQGIAREVAPILTLTWLIHGR